MSETDGVVFVVEDDAPRRESLKNLRGFQQRDVVVDDRLAVKIGDAKKHLWLGRSIIATTQLSGVSNPFSLRFARPVF